MTDPIYLTRDECLRVALAAFDNWTLLVRRSVKDAAADIDQTEIAAGLWGPDALVGLLAETIQNQSSTTGTLADAMAMFVEIERVAAGGEPGKKS